jgi:hypothetical protein
MIRIYVDYDVLLRNQLLMIIASLLIGDLIGILLIVIDYLITNNTIL